MKISVSSLLLKAAFGAFIGIISSCVTPHYMYAPTAENVPSFTKRNESSTGISFSNRGIDAQAGYAVSNHVALLGSWYGRWERQYDEKEHATALFSSTRTLDSVRYQRKLWSLGLTYYTPIDKNRHFFVMMTGGYGRGYFSMNEHSITKYPDADTLLSRNFYQYKAGTGRLYFMPAIMGHYESLKAIFSIRFSGNRYDHIRSTYSDGAFKLKENKLYIFTEPAFTLHVTPSQTDWLTIKLQGGFVFPSGNVSFNYRSFIGNIGAAIDPVKLFSR